MTEQWVTTLLARCHEPECYRLLPVANTVLRVTATTNTATGQTILAIYSMNSSGGVVALLANATLNAAPIGDRAGVFVIGGGNIQVQPYAIFP